MIPKHSGYYIATPTDEYAPQPVYYNSYRNAVLYIRDVADEPKYNIKKWVFIKELDLCK